MHIGNLTQASSIGSYFSDASRFMSSSVSHLSGLILVTSATALAGLGYYHWSKQGKTPAVIDPDFERVKTRVKQAYTYVFGGLALTAASAAIAHASGLSRVILENRYFIVPGTVILSIGALVTTMLTDKENTKQKHIALAVFNVAMGLSFSPLCYVQRAIVAQAAFITLGIGSLLTFGAYMAPDKQFLQWEGPLLTALSTLSIASFVAWFFPNTAFAYGVDRASLYGGLLIFSLLFMSNTQKLVDEAEKKDDKKFDPINASFDLYFNTLNIFLRVLRILLENQKKDDQTPVHG